MKIDVAGSTGDLSDIGALAFTSANGVRAFAASVAASGIDAPVFTVGPASAVAASAAGLHAPMAAAGDVESLAELIDATAKAAPFRGPVLHIAGSDRAGDLIALLAARSIPARRVVLYRAAPAATLSASAALALTDAAEPIAVALFSPRTARLFIEQVSAAGFFDRLANAIAVCLSPSVAEAAATAPWLEIRVAAELSAASMISTL